MSFRVSYWVLPIISGLVWLATLLGLLLHWVVNHDKGRYPSMSQRASIPYISNIGAHELKPLFIAGCILTSVFLNLSFAADQWLRHRGRLEPHTTRGQKILKGLAIFFAIIGAVGLILLSVLDTWRYKTFHNIFLAVFMGGYLLCAIFICWEYQLLRKNHREVSILRTSFLLKLFFVILELALCVAFGVCQRSKKHDTAAILEWVIACVFSFYIFSFTIDLWPAVHTKQVVVVAGRRQGSRLKVLTWAGWKRVSAPANGAAEMEEARTAEPQTEGTTPAWGSR